MLEPKVRNARVEALFDRAERSSTLDWRGLREEIHDLYGQVTTAERMALLGIYTAVMDAVERQSFAGRPDDLAAFREARRQDYNLLLVTETTIEGKVSPDLLDMVTAREVAAGRMAPDHELRRLAVEGVATMGRKMYQRDAPRGLFNKIRSWFGVIAG